MNHQPFELFALCLTGHEAFLAYGKACDILGFEAGVFFIVIALLTNTQQDNNGKKLYGYNITRVGSKPTE